MVCNANCLVFCALVKSANFIVFCASNANFVVFFALDCTFSSFLGHLCFNANPAVMQTLRIRMC